MMRAAEFYIASADDDPPRQGDILLAGVSRLVAEDRFIPNGWEELDTSKAIVEQEGRSPLRLATGPALVMITSHDCHFDKQWNRARDRLIRAGMDEVVATRQVNEDYSLDRTFTASPLIRPEALRVDLGNLKAGRMVGYISVPASADGLIPEAVVDLTYRATLDRLDVLRIASTSSTARAQLRLAMTRLDTLRSPTIGFDIEAVIGRQITKVEIPRRDPMLVRIQLDDGREIALLQQPGDPPAGPARTGFNERRGYY